MILKIMYMTVPIFRHLAWDKYNKQILCYVMKRLIVLVCIVCNASMKTVIFFLLTLHSTLRVGNVDNHATNQTNIYIF